MILVLLTLVLISIGINSSWVCHSSCAPGLCHGPSIYHCNGCGPNMVFRGLLCVCKPGWFDHQGGRCNLSLPYCVEAVPGGAGLSCTRCETSRDTLLNGQCTRSAIPFFLRVGSTYTNSLTNQKDLSAFISKGCKVLGTTGCTDCYPNTVLNTTSGICNSFNKLCEELSPTNSSACLVPVSGTYFTDRSLICFAGCRGCVGQSHKECISCMDGYYFERNRLGHPLGSCLRCVANCKVCTGPSVEECSVAFVNFYLTSNSGSAEIRLCPAGCLKCTSDTNCTHCNTPGQVSLNGVCTSSTLIANCKYQTNTTSTDGVCNMYKGRYITSTDGLPYGTELAYSTISAGCLNGGKSEWPDRITLTCTECQHRYTIFNGKCKAPVSSGDVEYCLYISIISSDIVFCSVCISGSVRNLNGTCSSLGDTQSCTAAVQGIPVTVAVYTDGSYCLACGYGCQECTQNNVINGELLCNICTADMILFNSKCMSPVCSDGNLSDNKQCDHNQPFPTEFECSADCMYFSSDCPSNSDCSRNIFQLKASATEENVMIFQIVDKYTGFYTFELNSGVSIFTVDSYNQQILCGLVLPDLDDPLTRCYSIKPSAANQSTVNHEIRIETTSGMMAKFRLKSTTSIMGPSVLLQRRFLNLTPEQTVSRANPVIPVIFENAKIKPVIAVTSATHSNLETDYHLTYTILQTGSEITSVKWSVTSCSVNGVPDPEKMESLNLSLIPGTSSISKLSLLDHMILEVKIVASYADGTTQENTGKAEFTNKPYFFRLLDSSTLVVHTESKEKPSVSVLFLFTYEPPTENEITLTYQSSQTNNAKVAMEQGVHYKVKLFNNTRRMLVTLISPWAKLGQNESNSVLVLVNVAGTLYTPGSIRLISKAFTDQASLVVPAVIGQNQVISFWTNLGDDFKYQVFAFSQTTSQNYFGTPLTSSKYNNVLQPLLSSATPGESVLLIFKFSHATSPYQAFYQRVITVSAVNSLEKSVVIPGTTFRDGSNLQSSNELLTLGVYRFSKAGTTASPSTSHLLTRYSAGQLLTSESSLTVTKTNAGLQMSPPISSLTSSAAAITSFTSTFTESSPASFTCLLKVFNEPTVTFTATHLTALSFEAVFEMSAAVSSSVNLWHAFDKTQFGYSLMLAYAEVGPQLTYPVFLPDVGRYLYLNLDSSIFTRFTSNASLPRARITVYDFNKFVRTAYQPLTPSDSWTPAPMAVDMYITTLNNSLTASMGNGEELLRKLNLAIFTCNQAFLSCKTGGSCLPEDAPIRNMREMLWTQYTGFWKTVTEKDAFQDWTTSALRNSFIGALTLTGESVSDSTIVDIEADLARELASLTKYISDITVTLPRTSYELVERLKANLRITLQNIELQMNAYTHMIRLYGIFYIGLGNHTEYRAKMNEMYLKTMVLNEVKLLRYTMLSEITLFENELMLMGGTTILNPLSNPDQVFNFGETLAVQLKNVELNSSSVRCSLL